MELAKARFNMIEQQIRPWDVLDTQVLDLLELLPREDYVPLAEQSLAYADVEIPLPHDQIMMKPIHEARMIQALKVRDCDNALEIGTGSGYTTALLARSCRHVDTVEIYPDLSKTAQARHQRQDITNVDYHIGDASNEWAPDGRYDVIAFTGSTPILPEAYLKIMNRGARLFAIIGEAPAMTAILVTRTGEEEWTTEELFETDVPCLINAEQPPRFSF